MSILIIYRPPYSGGNSHTGFRFVEEFGDLLGDRLKNIDMRVKHLNFPVKDSKNLAFQDLLESFGLIQNVECPAHQSGHTLF